MAKKEQVANWGNFPRLEAEVHRPGFVDEIKDIIAASPHLLARGNGRCYGDAALNERLVSTLKLNKLLAFDAENGILHCQAGVLLSDILDFIVPNGWFLPVTPGTRFITVGGAIAADVHGKNHHRDGCFSDHLLAFEIMDGQGQVHECRPDHYASLFWNTVGNMGLTGIILSARFQLKPIETAYIRQETIKAPNLDAIMDHFEASLDWTYTVAWIDCYQKGTNAGRSLLIRGEHARLEELPSKWQKQPLQLKPRRQWSMPFYFPAFVLNPLSIRLFNFLFYHKQLQAIQKTIVPYDTFFYPLDAIHHWNRMYGKPGFTQYQFVLPKATSREGLPVILNTIRRSGQGSFLTVLKLFGPNNPTAIHSFPMEGYTLALDFKMNSSLPVLITTLDELVRQYAGRIYRAKDACSRPELSRFSPLARDQKFRSLQAKRLDLLD